MLKKTLEITILTDSAMLFKVLIYGGNTSEKRLVLEIKYARAAYKEGIISDII